jgi:hypothetical protein
MSLADDGGNWHRITWPVAKATPSRGRSPLAPYAGLWNPERTFKTGNTGNAGERCAGRTEGELLQLTDDLNKWSYDLQ